MKFEDVNSVVKGIPFISERNARSLYKFILDNKLKNCLELGFAHGVATCYMAAALDEMKEGKIVSVDLMEAQNMFKPDIHELLRKLNLEAYVEIHREATGYNWFLHDEIFGNSQNESNVCHPKYDFCIIDGPKNWTIDSSAFFLADKLLKEGGWIVFDDYNWTYAVANRSRDATDGISHRRLSENEKRTAHIKEIFHLLVMQHPSYSNFKIQQEGDWVWAQKIQGEVKKVSYIYSTSIRDLFVKALLKVKNKIIA
jgi:predicted O-methyltransferase YrrM